jgi:hypothetical protein
VHAPAPHGAAVAGERPQWRRNRPSVLSAGVVRAACGHRAARRSCLSA